MRQQKLFMPIVENMIYPHMMGLLQVHPTLDLSIITNNISIHTICLDLLQVVADGMKETLQERVHEGFERGYLTSEIWDELFTVLYAIGDDDQPINLEKRIGAYMEALRKTRMKATTDFKEHNPASAPETEPSLHAIEQDGASDNF